MRTLLTIQDVANHFRVTTRTIYRWRKIYHLQVLRIRTPKRGGGTVLIPEESVCELEEALMRREGDEQQTRAGTKAGVLESV